MSSLSREELRIKHLEMIQGVVNRLAGNSFSIKGWALTITAAIFALATNDSAMPYVCIAVIPDVFFWGLDAYYLRQERLFRALYDRVRKSTAWPGAGVDEPGKEQDPSEVELFSMDTRQGQVASWGCTWRTGTLLGFYGPLLLVVLGFCTYGYVKPKNDLDAARSAALVKIGDSASALSKSPAPDAMARALDRLAGAVERISVRPDNPPPAAPVRPQTPPASPPSGNGNPAKSKVGPHGRRAP